MSQQDNRPLAWFGDPDLKATVIAKLKQHRAMDEIVQGHYQLTGEEFIVGNHAGLGVDVTTAPKIGAYKGCAVGCTLPQISAERQAAGDFNWHKELELQYGIPAFIAAQIDDAFESTDGFAAAADFAIEVIEAIPVGANLWPTGYCSRDRRVEPYPCNVDMCYSCLAEATPQELIHILAMAPVPDAE